MHVLRLGHVSLQETQKRHGGVQFAILKNIFGSVKNYKHRDKTKRFFALISVNPNKHPVTRNTNRLRLIEPSAILGSISGVPYREQIKIKNKITNKNIFK